jgi:hypothetical protein
MVTVAGVFEVTTGAELSRSKLRATVILGCALVFCWLGVGRSIGQVVFSSDFSSWADFHIWGLEGTGGSPFPDVNADLFDRGNSSGNALMLSVDSSQCTQDWGADWTGIPNLKVSPPPYDPARIYINFEASVSKLRPFWVKFTYVGGSTDIRNVIISVTPTLTNSFQPYSMPLSAFTVTILRGNPPDAPTSVIFGIGFAWPGIDAPWGYDTNNVLMIDNLSYVVVPPPLNISSSDGNVIVSWASDTTSYVLQQNSDLNTTNWSAVTNLPFISDGRSQVVISNAVGSSFYRLRSP